QPGPSPPLGTILGVFDGHGGPVAACFAYDHLFPWLLGDGCFVLVDAPVTWSRITRQSW
ncbi:unnamed protein product, partial [Urochloa humidicola]